MYQRATLPNGVRILTSTLPHVRSVSLIFYFGVGSRYESPELNGASHLIEHMLFKGTERYPTAQAISESIEGVGGALDAGTDKESTVYSTKVGSAHFELALDLLTDMVRRPKLDSAELEKERRVIIEELNMYRDSPQDWVGVLGEEVFWPDLPLGREVAGTRETVSSISREALERYRLTHYVPGNLIVSVAGNVEHDQVVEALAQRFGDWADAPVPAWTPCPPPLETPRIRLENRRTEQTNLVLYTLGLPHKSPRYYVQVLLTAILGDGMSSRLFQEVREERGLAYDVSASPENYHDCGAFIIYAGVEPRKAQSAVTAIIEQLDRLRREPVSIRELTRAKEYTKGRMALRLEDTYSVAAWLGGQEAYLGQVHELDDILTRIDLVTADDIQQLAQELFRDEWLRLAMIGPHRDATPYERLLHL